MLKAFFTDFKNNFPSKIFFISIALWVALALVNFILFQSDFYTGVGILYPFSVIYPSAFLASGFLFGLMFLILGFYALKNVQNFNFFYLLLFCFCLILGGNMMQGNADITFMQPFYLKGRQYYTDAVQIQNWQNWLRDFNHNLDAFQMHTKTHPPFTTLLHYFILNLFRGNVLALGLVFFLISFITIPAFYQCLKLLNFTSINAKRATLLFSIIPSVNIYLLVSIDGIIVALMTIFLYGLLLIIKNKKNFILSYFLCIITFILTNLLSFSGLFILAFLGVLSFNFLRKKDFKLIYLSIAIVFFSLIFFYWIFQLTGYNQWQTFRHASHSENPRGFMAFSMPKVYFFTRLEDVGEILFFLSFAVLAVIFSKGFFKKLNKVEKSLFFSAISALVIMFLTGAYGTGETARACLFIVPFFIFLFKELPTKTFMVLFILCLLQTFAMQLICNFYW